MDFTLDDDQLALRGLVADVLGERVSLERVLAQVEGKEGMDTDTWAVLAHQVGLLGVCLPHEHGGQSLGLVELAVIAEETGRAFYPAPVLATIVGLRYLARCGAAETVERLLAEGIGVAHTLRGAATPWPLPSYSPHVVSGYLPQVADVVGEVMILCEVKLPGENRGIALVDPTADGVLVQRLPGLDPTRPVAAVELERAPAQAYEIPGPDESRPAEAEAKLAMAAEIVGVAQRCLDMTVSFTKQRVQFGRPIGSFQAVKHSCAEMLVELELARTAVYLAACRGDEDARQLEASSAAAFAQAARMAVQVAGATIQLHGGIGFTWEYPAHLLTNRLRSSALAFGGVEAQNGILWENARLREG